MSGRDVESRDNTVAEVAAVASARPVVLLRVRPGLVAESARVVHLVALPGAHAAVVTALCGALLCCADCEHVTPGRGMPCARCLAGHLTSSPPPEGSGSALARVGTGARAAASCYRSWGWPVLTHRDQVWLSLAPGLIALVLPTPLVTDLVAVLDRRCCPPALLAHPDLPDHQVLLAGERHDVALPWPPEVHQVTDAVPLPPTTTTTGQLTWVRPPQPTSLGHCREIDVRTALHALGEPPASGPVHF